jgi:ADP-heptose:LPS heptosyltransferase
MIDVVVNRPVLPLAARCSHLDRALTVKRSVGRISFDGLSPAHVAAFESDYGSRCFDLAIVPRWDVDFDGAGEIAERSRAPVIVGFSETCTERKRLLNRGQDDLYTRVLHDRRLVHEVELNLALITAMNGRIKSRQLSLDLTKADQAAAARTLSPMREKRPLLAIAPFASEPKRCLPVEVTARLIAPLLGGLFGGAVIIGGAPDRLAGEKWASELGDNAVSIAGRCELGETAAVIRNCHAMIASDSGAAHIAAAVGTPVAVASCHPLSGRPEHENSPLRFAPWAEPGRVLVLQPECAVLPCRDHCQAAEPHCVVESAAQGARRLYDFLRRAIEDPAFNPTGDMGSSAFHERTTDGPMHLPEPKSRNSRCPAR